MGKNPFLQGATKCDRWGRKMGTKCWPGGLARGRPAVGLVGREQRQRTDQDRSSEGTGEEAVQEAWPANPACTRPGSRPGRPENRCIDRMNQASALGSRPAASLGPARKAAGPGTQQSEPAKARPRPSQREKEADRPPEAPGLVPVGGRPGRPAWPSFFFLFSVFKNLFRKNTPRIKPQ